MEVSGLRHDLEILFAVEQQLQTTTHHLVIVGEHEPHRRRRPSVRVGDSSLSHDRRDRPPYRRKQGDTTASARSSSGLIHEDERPDELPERRV